MYLEKECVYLAIINAFSKNDTLNVKENKVFIPSIGVGILVILVNAAYLSPSKVF